MADKLTVPSGADVEIRIGSFTAGMKLKNAVEKELARQGLAFFPGGVSKEKEIDLEKMLPAILMIDSSEVVQAAMWECLTQSTYNGERISTNTFEPEKARGDYYAIMLAAGKKNLMPFISGLVSGLGGIGKMMSLIGQK